jgi:ABC-type sugar transport system permease subunit
MSTNVNVNAAGGGSGMTRDYTGRRTVAGLFTERADAERAINDLKAAGFRPDDVGVAMRDRTQQGELVEETGTKAAEGAGTGALGGGILGGLVGWLVGIGALAIPGIGPVVAGGALATAFGLAVAVLADRAKGENAAKSLIFLPMAIGAVSAGAIWRFVYVANPPNQNQIGLLNGIWTGLGGEPVQWLQLSTLRANSFLLMVILLWIQVGFAMVLLSAAIKAVPTETLEAARLDGAGEGAIFFRIVIPQIRTTLITVFITVLIGVLKTFDIVYVMTNGNFNTNIIAVEFFNQLFTNRNNGYAAAIVVMLLIAMIPILVFQVRQFRAEEAAR